MAIGVHISMSSRRVGKGGWSVGAGVDFNNHGLH